ncbi:MAG: hypothetical protein RIQ56_250 [Candidatus Parcubacteria bacterium]
MGLGVLGRGVGDARFIAAQGASVLVTDLKSEDNLTQTVELLKDIPNVEFRLGGHRKDDFINTDMVIKGAGVPLNSPFIQAARDAGIPVYMSTALAANFAMESGVEVVGVTGTRGKSTVSQMIFNVLQHTALRRAHLGGNIRGVSTLELLPNLRRGDVLVLELDSWQLQGFGDLGISPNIAVFTNFMQDHLNYYPDMETYFADKAKIFINQNEGDCLFVGNSILSSVEAAHPPVAPKVPAPLQDNWRLQIPGEHNRENASLAVAALGRLGIPTEKIKEGIEAFSGIEGRLQLLGEKGGVKIYNDNNSTTPQATIAALRALDNGNRNVVLIVGGNDKQIDMSQLLQQIPMSCKAVVLFKEKGTDRIRDAVFAMKDVSVFEEEGLKSTAHRAFSLAASGDVVLFSPAFTSFGTYFRNEFDRGDQFIELAKEFIETGDVRHS